MTIWGMPEPTAGWSKTQPGIGFTMAQSAQEQHASPCLNCSGALKAVEHLGWCTSPRGRSVNVSTGIFLGI